MTVSARPPALASRSARASLNEKAKRELGWQPRYASWRHGFAQGLERTI